MERDVSSSHRINSILVLDDEPQNLAIVAELLAHRLSADVLPTRFPSEAVRLAAERVFDLVILDVTLNYRGSPFGGLEVYGEILPRYGTESVIAYSEVITDAMLRNYSFVDNFVDKHLDPVVFANELSRIASTLRARQTCFVAMPFSGAYSELHKAIAKAVEAAGFIPVRVDQEQFTASIVAKIFSEIRRSKIVVFVATDRNPNAFYECGYAVALNKEVVTVTNDLGSLPFDIRDRNALSYGSDLSELCVQLTSRLLGVSKGR